MAQDEYDAAGVTASYWTANAAQITWDTTLNAGLLNYADFCVSTGETFEFFLVMSAEPGVGGGGITEVRLVEDTTVVAVSSYAAVATDTYNFALFYKDTVGAATDFKINI